MTEFGVNKVYMTDIDMETSGILVIWKRALQRGICVYKLR